MSPQVPVAFRRTGIRFLGILSRRGVPPLSRSAYRTTTARTRRGFHVPRTQDTTEVGAPSTPRPAVSTRPAVLPSRRLPPLPAARPYHPGLHPVIPSLQ
jgi:hypothetical protein